MKLKKLIADLPLTVHHLKEVEITGLTAHSKFVAPGDLFIAKKGSRDSGENYLEEAALSGAVAILSNFYNPFLKQVVQLVHPDVHRMEALLAARFYQAPSDELFTVGVTGTNGKTTTTYLIKHLLDHLGLLTGLIGTVKYIVGDHHFEAPRTTPDVITNHKLLREMVKRGCKAVAMEASSHGLAQGRCDEIHFDAAVFTNLSQEHLDYHKTMEAYAAEKAKLFAALPQHGTAVICSDSPWAERMLSNCRSKVLRYGFSLQAHLLASNLETHVLGSRFDLSYGSQTLHVQIPLIGKFNVLNALAAIGVALSKGYSLEMIAPFLSSFPSVPGRMEKVHVPGGPVAVVDYAHTPEALRDVLNALSQTCSGKIFTVFGAGGERDQTKRPLMGEAVERGGDFAIITTDNPRGENPLSICEQVASGFSGKNWQIVLDRKEAIQAAIARASPEDLILIAGKGHETYQLSAHRSLPFDDRKIVLELLTELSLCRS